MTMGTTAVHREPLERALGWLREQTGPMEQLLAALVEVNSHTDNPDGGRRVGRLLSDALADLPLERRVYASSRYADHLVFANTAPGSPVALVGHLDTVFPAGTFEGYRREDALARGPGVLDMKGGLVVCIFALHALATAGVLDRLPIRFVIVSDEEVGSPEGKNVIRAEASGAAAGLVFEAGRETDAVVTRRKGVGAVRAIARGRAAHAGNAHGEGANAIWALTRFVDRAQALTDYARGTTVNVGKIAGGHGANVVPEQAEAEVDLRFTIASEGDSLMQALREAAADAARAVAGTSLELSGGILRPPLERTEAVANLFREYAACAKLEGLGSDEATLVGGGSDASTLSALGVAAIDGLGPRGKGFHTSNEQIDFATLIPKTGALVRFLYGRVGAGS